MFNTYFFSWCFNSVLPCHITSPTFPTTLYPNFFYLDYYHPCLVYWRRSSSCMAFRMTSPSLRFPAVIPNPYKAWRLERVPQPSLIIRDSLGGVELPLEVSVQCALSLLVLADLAEVYDPRQNTHQIQYVSLGHWWGNSPHITTMRKT